MNPLKALTIYSFLMITLPIAGYFLSKKALEDFFGVSSDTSYIYATVTSVIAIHVVLALFVYEAYNEKPMKIIYEEDKRD